MKLEDMVGYERVATNTEPMEPEVIDHQELGSTAVKPAYIFEIGAFSRNGGPENVALLLLARSATPGRSVGLSWTLTPAEARKAAAELDEIADDIEKAARAN